MKAKRDTLRNPPGPPQADCRLPLDGIQSNILGGFLKDHQYFLFVNMKDAKRAKRWLADLTPSVANSAQVIEFNRSFKALRGKRAQQVLKARWMNIAFSHAGLRKLSVKQADLDAFPTEFKEGMAARAKIIGDEKQNAPSHWIKPLGRHSIHAVVLLAADDPDDLSWDIRRHRQLLRAHDISIAFEQSGEIRRDQPGHEHLGYDDGVSQPGVRDARVTPPTTADRKTGLPGQDRVWPGEILVGWPRQFDPFDPAHRRLARQATQRISPSRTARVRSWDLSVRPDATTQMPPDKPTPDWTLNGSYLVFRRLRQDVPAFRRFIEVQSRELDMAPGLLMAKLVGRYQSGAPLERTHDQPSHFDPEQTDPSTADPSILSPTRVNNFDYVASSNDQAGKRVPHAAHIRKFGTVRPRAQIPGPRPII